MDSCRVSTALQQQSDRIISRSHAQGISEAWNDDGHAKGSGDQFYSKCPLHNKEGESLSILWVPGKDGNGDILFNCHGHCSWKEIYKKAEDDGLIPKWAPTKRVRTGATVEFWIDQGFKHITCYPYQNEDGVLLYEKHRFLDLKGKKTYRQRRADGNGGFDRWKLDDKDRSTRKVLYNLPAICKAIQTAQTIFIMEGEKDCDLAVKDGLIATCNFDGAGKWREEDSEPLIGAARIIQVIDNDWAGYEHLNLVGASLLAKGQALEWIVMPGVKEHGDYSDWRAEYDADIFEGVVEEAKLWTEPVKNPYPDPVTARKLKELETQALEAAKIPETVPFGAESNVVPIYREEKIDIFQVELWTDAGNAKRFKQYHEGDAYFTKAAGWILWNEKKFDTDGQGLVVELAKATARKIVDETAFAQPEKLIKFAAKTLDERGYTNMLKSARSLMPSNIRDFNANPDIINTQDGVVDLLTGKLHPHDRKFMCSLITKCGYSEEAFADFMTITDEVPIEDRELIYEKWIPAYMDMARWICGTPEMTTDWEKFDYLQDLAGYCFSGRTHIQQAWFFEGGGRNLKSTWIDNLYFMLGEEEHGYSVSVRPEMFMRQRGAGENHMDNFSQLQDKRMTAVQELNSDDSLDERKFKSVTGYTDRLKGRYMRGEPFDIRNTSKFIFRTQFMPRIRNQDDGVWRRMRRVPCHNQLPESAVDLLFNEKIEAEWSALAAFFVSGLIRVTKRKALPTPACVKLVTDEYKAEMDVIGDMLQECFVKLPGNELSILEFLRVHKQYCALTNQHAYSKIELGRRLNAIPGIQRGRVVETNEDGTKTRPHTYIGYAVKQTFESSAGSGSRY